MIRFLAVAAACLAMTACAAGPMTAGDMGFGAFDYTPSDERRQAGARFGYDLQGDGDWQGRLDFVDAAGGPQVDFIYASVRDDDASGELRIAMPYLDGGVRRYEGLAADGRDVAVRLQAGPCEVAGERHTHFAALRIGAIAVTGCADERAAQDRWSNYLMDFMPAIDLCLGEVGDQAQHVSLAYVMPRGTTGVRVVDVDNRTWECVTRDEDSAINSLRPIDAADTLLGEGDPVFVRHAVPELGAGCYIYESVRHADGALIGAFGFDACDAAPVALANKPLTRS